MLRCAWLVVVLSAFAWGSGSALAQGCVGDCNGDGEVTVDEVVRGVNVALGGLELTICPAFDRDGDAVVAIDEIVAAVGFLLNGCPAIASPPLTRTATPTPTATPIPNRPPSLTPAVWYRAYVGYPVRLVLGASDPDGDALRCSATGLPSGARMDETTATIEWVPEPFSAGQHDVTVECRDPVGHATGARVVFSVAEVTSCAEPVCDPAVGCSRELVSLAAPCCPVASSVELAVPDLPCPAGRAVWVSEDIDGGFRPLHDCDLKYVRNNAQAAAEVRFKFRARCFSLDDRILLTARMETRERTPVIDDRYRVRFYEAGPDLVESRTVQFEVRPPAPFFDMQDAEANLVVTLTDGRLQTHTESLRLRLTFTPVPTPP
ncbi:MAG: Ig domain-containing protein [Candidatus Binatia bacterium]|nr:Ig domain-containing protein [Candidatus Binatia bacterium]